jgi:hypothetical protein
MFRHPLVSNYILSVFAKLPIHDMSSIKHVMEIVCYRIAVSVFQRRIAARYIEGDAQFHMIEYEIADSSREGTCVVSLTITAEPKDWESATRAAVQVCLYYALFVSFIDVSTNCLLLHRRVRVPAPCHDQIRHHRLVSGGPMRGVVDHHG